MAAGLGTRLKPITDKIPKPLIEVGGKTLLEIAVAYLKKHGIGEIIINVHHFPDQIIEYVKANRSFGVHIEFSDERNQLMDTGGGIWKASDFLSESNPFVVITSDVLTDMNLHELLNYHKSNNALVTLAVKKRQTSRALLFDEDMRLVGWRDNRTGHCIGKHGEDTVDLGFSTVHAMDPKIFQLYPMNGPFSITKLYLDIMKDELIKGFRHDENGWLEFGRLERLKEQSESTDFNKMIRHLF